MNRRAAARSSSATSERHRSRHSAGFSYVEVLIAIMVLSIATVPAMQALQTAVSTADVLDDELRRHYLRVSKMEESRALPYATLLQNAASAGNKSTPTSLGDPAGPGRRLVYIALYDGDGTPFDVPDLDLDGDADPFTGYEGLLWIAVVQEEGGRSLETLVLP